MIFMELLQSFGGADGARTRARLAPARVFREITLPSPTLQRRAHTMRRVHTMVGKKYCGMHRFFARY